MEVLLPEECAAPDCERPPTRQWVGASNGVGLGFTALTVTWWFCDEHDKWHRDHLKEVGGRPVGPTFRTGSTETVDCVGHRRTTDTVERAEHVTGLDEWVVLLRSAHVRAGRPSTRLIASSVGLSHSAVAEILNGRSRPHRRNLLPLAAHLCDGLEPGLVEEIMESYDASAPEGWAISEEGSPSGRRDAELIAAALHDIADAIRGLGKTP